MQDPDDAEQTSMPLTALNNVEVDYCLPVSEIANVLVRLTQGSVGPERERGSAVSDKLGIETKIALGQNSADLDVTQLGKLSEFTCPEMSRHSDRNHRRKSATFSLSHRSCLLQRQPIS